MTTKEILMDLVRSHASASVMDRENRSQLEVNDIIPGKGKGLVILLYGRVLSALEQLLTLRSLTSSFIPGPPGVGKTLTAETISTATRKPLFSVSVADVGTDPKKVEGNLDKIFALATKWQAILLMYVTSQRKYLIIAPFRPRLTRRDVATKPTSSWRVVVVATPSAQPIKTPSYLV